MMFEAFQFALSLCLRTLGPFLAIRLSNIEIQLQILKNMMRQNYLSLPMTWCLFLAINTAINHSFYQTQTNLPRKVRPQAQKSLKKMRFPFGSHISKRLKKCYFRLFWRMFAAFFCSTFNKGLNIFFHIQIWKLNLVLPLRRCVCRQSRFGPQNQGEKAIYTFEQQNLSLKNIGDKYQTTKCRFRQVLLHQFCDFLHADQHLHMVRTIFCLQGSSRDPILISRKKKGILKDLLANKQPDFITTFQATSQLKNNKSIEKFIGIKYELNDYIQAYPFTPFTLKWKQLNKSKDRTFSYSDLMNIYALFYAILNHFLTFSTSQVSPSSNPS